MRNSLTITQEDNQRVSHRSHANFLTENSHPRITRRIIQTQILIVDDEREITEEIAELLENEGFCADTTTDPVEAINMVKGNNDISIVVTDLSMPNLTGLEMIERMNSELPSDRHLEFIVLTGQSDTQRAVGALRLGALDFLSKPIDPDILLHTLNRAVDHVRLERLESEFRVQLERKVLERTEEVQKLSSDLLEANDVLIIKNAELEASNQVKSEFLSLISHELRTPLNHIIGFSSLMKMTCEEVGNANDADYNGKILDAGNDLLQIISTILDLININGEDCQFNKSEIDLPVLINSVHKVLAPKAEKSGVDLLLDLKNAPATIYADEPRLTQVIGNVLDNAIRFTDGTGTVVVAAVSTDDQTIISVADQGIGMSEDEVRIAEEPFRQVDASLSKKAYGMGLGLTLSKSIIEHHGGVFSVESTPGEGTLVTISLPQNGEPA